MKFPFLVVGLLAFTGQSLILFNLFNDPFVIGGLLGLTLFITTMFVGEVHDE